MLNLLGQPSNRGRNRGQAARGVSLIEALVAMGVMAFGILGVMGVQASLRSNADLARQRSQATRIAHEKLESLRRFSTIAATAGRHAYADIAATSSTTIEPDSSNGNNTRYSVSHSVQDSSLGNHKELLVTVSWADRSGQTQQVRLTSVLAKQDPQFAASVAIKPNGSPTANPLGRQRSIPIGARDFGDGTSGFRPPQPSGGTTALLFDNATGLITSCITTVASNADLRTSADISGCDNTTGAPRYKLLAGYVRYATGATQPSLYNILNAFGPLFPDTTVQLNQSTPVSRTATCFSGLNIGGDYLAYYCLMQVQSTPFVRGPGLPVGPPGSWSGSIEFMAPALSMSLADNNASLFKVCRYQSNGSYSDERSALVNENFVMTRSGDDTTAFFCPFTPGRRDVWPHQPST